MFTWVLLGRTVPDDAQDPTPAQTHTKDDGRRPLRDKAGDRQKMDLA